MINITNQLTIKLNEERFRPLLDDLTKVTGMEKSYSEIVAKCVFWCHKLAFEKCSHLDGKSGLHHLAEAKGDSIEEALLKGLKEYNDFCKKDK